MGIRFAGDHAFSRRRPLSVEARHAQIKAAPEKMYWTRLADKSGTKFFEHAVGRKQNPPKPAGVFGIVRRVRLIRVQRDWIRNFLRLGIDPHINSNLAQHPESLA